MEEPQVKSGITLAGVRQMSPEERRRRYPEGFVEDYTTLPQELLDRAQQRMDELATQQRD